ncbi:MAG: Bax inhibitor-1/YccA family protein [bacterium]
MRKTEMAVSEENRFLTSVFGWMFLGLMVTALVAFFISTIPSLSQLVMKPVVWIPMIIFQFILVIKLSGSVEKMSALGAMVMFLSYSILNGVTISFVFIIYTSASIFSTFLITSLMFGAMAAYGYFTKKDLTSWGSFFFMGLIGLIIAGIFNLFWFNETIYWVTTFIGIIVFVGLTAYDVQKIKQISSIGVRGSEENTKNAVRGALSLYLDFINLFLYLLRIFGKD